MLKEMFKVSPKEIKIGERGEGVERERERDKLRLWEERGLE